MKIVSGDSVFYEKFTSILRWQMRENFSSYLLLRVLHRNDRSEENNIFFLGEFLRRIFTCACEDALR